jgi:subtilisin family serine protease
MDKKDLYYLFIFTIIIFFIETVLANPLSSKADVKYDSDSINFLSNITLVNEILNKSNFSSLEIYNNQVWLNVIVRLKDNSNIEIQGIKEEKINLLMQKENWFNPQVDKILSSLYENEFKLEHKLTNGFSGWINLEGYNKLISNSLIKEVDWPKVRAKVMLNDSASIIGVNPYVWELNYTGDGKKVCVIDTGVNTNHLALYGKIIDEYCYCADGLFSGCCPDDTDEDDSAEDEYGHGTKVAGVIASQHEMDRGISYGVNLYVVRFTNDLGKGTLTDVGDAIDWCRNQGVDLISISMGGWK